MERRSFLFFLPMLVLTPKVIARTFIDLGNHTSVVEFDIIAKEMELAYQHIDTLFWRDSIFYEAIVGEGIIVSRDMRVPLMLKPGKLK